MCSVCRSRHPFPHSWPFLVRQGKGNNTVVTSAAGTVYTFGRLEFKPVLSWGHVVRSVVFCVICCRLLLVFLSFTLWQLSCVYSSSNYSFWLRLWYLRFTASDIFKLFLSYILLQIYDLGLLREYYWLKVSRHDFTLLT